MTQGKGAIHMESLNQSINQKMERFMPIESINQSIDPMCERPHEKV